MSKHILTLIFPLLSMLTLSAQYGNAWIDFSKTYYKFKIAEDGVYRIPASVLQASGLGGIPGAQFRLYTLGEEVAIYTSAEGAFGPADFIEFAGEMNRGQLDRKLYQNPDAQQLNPAHSMFTDTAAYFLTWDNAGPGKRLTGVVNDLTNPPAAEPYYMHQENWVYSDASLDPRNASAGSGISYSRYQEAEGFASQSTSSFSLDLPASMIYTQGADAVLDFRLGSATLTSHHIIGLLDADTLLQENGSLFKLYQVVRTRAATALSANQLLKIEDFATNARIVVSSVSWTYPRLCDFTGRAMTRFRHEADGSTQYFELTNFMHGGADPVVLDLNAGVRLVSSRNGNTVRFMLPAYAGERDLIVASPSGSVLTIDNLTERTFTDFSGDNTEYVIITHPALRAGDDMVGQYGAYRSSPAGGGYHVNIYSIEDLYDQFGYGVSKHPQAIRNFNQLIGDQWTATKMVLIIGKGVSYPYSRTHGGLGEQVMLIPTFGQPGADHLLFSDNGVSIPDLPVGRLPVTTQDQLRAYLDKLVEYDLVPFLPQTIEDKAWIKQILHLGGGQDADQQNQLLGLLNAMASIAENSDYGATVSTFTKNSTNTTGQSNSDKIVEILHSGAAVVKFFGHSSASTLDFQINNPRDWQNKGKYPIFSAMGCKAGDIHQDYTSLSETFVFEPNAGTIAFIAGSGSQYLSTLGNWGKDWYETWGNNAAGLTLGEVILESLKDLNQSDFTDALLIEQQTLNGDPAVRFYPMPGSDLLWDYTSLRHVPEVLTTELDSFTIKADIVNLGVNYQGNLQVRVEQKFPNATQTEVYLGDVVIQGFRTPVEFSIPMSRTASGLNTLFLTLDVPDALSELPSPAAEENNELVNVNGKKGFDVFILDNRAKATYPMEFSIVTESFPTLIATSTNAFVKGATFVMELDTTPEFNSPILLRQYFTDFWGAVRWKPVYTFVPGTVYYWRVNTEHGDEQLWDSSSFLYNPGGRRGWNQSHYGQFQKDELVNLDFNGFKQLSFDTTYRNIWVQNKVDVEPDLSDDPVVYINNTLRRDFFTFYENFDAHVFVIAIDSFSARFLRNAPGGSFGSVNPSANSIVVFPYNTSTEAGRSALIAFLENQITDGMYAIIYTYQRPGFMDYYPEQWAADEQTLGKSIFSVIEAQAPGSEVRQLENGAVPYLLYYRKNRDLIFEGIANQLEETISFDYNFISRANSGDLFSTTIGPARAWHEFQWAVDFSSIPANDIISAQLIALNASMTDSLILDVTTLQDTTLDFIDAKLYPYMQLTFHTADQPDLTAAAVNYWRVLYEGMPDLVINPAGGFEFEGDSLMVGQPMNLTTTVENLGEDLTESVRVRFTITDSKNTVVTQMAEISSLKSGELAPIHLTRQTLDLVGKGSLLVEVNSDRTVMENTYLNNTGILNFVMLADDRNPTLDVTFDGRHLLNGDVVSSEPVIRATLRDDNLFLLLTEKKDFELYLRFPNDFNFTEIDLDGSDISFDPAISGAQNTATLFFRPVLADGFYDLIIRAEDRSANQSGVLEYAISFEVLGGRLISSVEAHPTVFNDFTRFVFTISGTQTPAEILLEIANAAGQVVRVIGKDEIGLFVGTTEYAWDGTTDSGERLSGGVYFYRLTARDHEGNSYELTGPGFRAGRDAYVGKLVIIR